MLAMALLASASLKRIIICVQLSLWSFPCGHAVHLRSGRTSDLATRRSTRKGHFAHLALQPVKAHIPRSSFRQCLTGFIHVPVAFYGMGKMRTAQPAASDSETPANKGKPLFLYSG
jgi:hypothetical protein